MQLITSKIKTNLKEAIGIMDVADILSRLSVQEEKLTTGIVFDDRMIEHENLWDSNHIERPERYSVSLQKCKDYNLINKCMIINSRFATDDELQLVHSKNYLDIIRNTKSINFIPDLETLASRFDSVYFHPKTYDSASLSAGCVLELVTSILNKKIKNGMAIVRPPGHHAMTEEACGFCFCNNAAIAARYALKHFNIRKILIIDWDVHHGQATQEEFFNDPRVLYFSIHRYEQGGFWPNLRESNFDSVGGSQAQGFNFNIPLNATKLGNTEYLAIFNNILLPVAYEFCPELVLISAGYDAAIGCPEGEMEVTPHAYAHFLNMISNLANGCIGVILEGGYCLTSLSESVAITLRALLGYPCPMIAPNTEIHDSAVESILNVISVQRPFWKSLQIQNTYDSNLDIISSGNQHVVDIKFNGIFTKPAVYPTRGGYPVQEPHDIAIFEKRIRTLIEETDLHVPVHKTGLVFDIGMSKHINKREKNHPEKADRVLKIYEKLQDQGLLSECLILKSRKAAKSELELVHDSEYIDKMEATANMSDKSLAKLESKYESIYLCQATFDSAILACGSLLQTIDAVVQKQCSNGFALIRPPGHHAEQSEACGFCIFNSVAIAAKYLISKYSMKKILIVDWDIHHGNGIQHIFYDNDNVLYISLHLYNGDFFPGLEEASYEAVGKGKGEGFNINIPWSATARDGDYLSAFFNIILPVAYEFCPDFVLVSAGFDALRGDPLGNFLLTPSCFGIMTKLLSGLAYGKVVLALEGGYNLKAISEAVVCCVQSLLGECISLPESVKPSDVAIKTIQAVVEVQKKYWKCLRFNLYLPNLPDFVPYDYIKLKEGKVPCKELPVPNENNQRQSSANSINLTVSSEGGGGINFDGLFLHCVTPIEDCPHLELLAPLPHEGLDPFSVCQTCHDAQENWVCLHCYQVHCGRYINEHMLLHGLEMEHFLTLSYTDLSVWCYGCESYVHNQVLVPIKQHAHLKKFGVPI